MKKLFLLPFILITILSCNNDCNNEILEKAESNEILSSKVTSSIATESYLSKYLLLECGGYHATSRNQDDFYESLIDDYDLSTQQVIVSNKEEGHSDYVLFYRLDDSEFISICGDNERRNLEVLSYDQSVFSSTQTRNGCSVCIGLAGIPWSTGFGMVNPVAGIARSICFMIMSEALC